MQPYSTLDMPTTRDAHPSPTGTNNQRCIGVTEIATTKWLSLQKITYLDRFGVPKTWDRCVRSKIDDLRFNCGSDNQTKLSDENSEEAIVKCQTEGQQNPQETQHKMNLGCPSIPLSIDVAGVMVLAFTTSGTIRDGFEEAGLLFVKQYRPPVDTFTIEFPSGLIDPHENPVTAGLRELKEETGYTGSDPFLVSPDLVVSPGAVAESLYIIVTEVDLDATANTQPQQGLQDDEDIEILILPSVGSRLIKELQKLKSEGNAIYDCVYCIALAFAMAGAFNVKKVREALLSLYEE